MVHFLIEFKTVMGDIIELKKGEILKNVHFKDHSQITVPVGVPLTYNNCNMKGLRIYGILKVVISHSIFDGDIEFCEPKGKLHIDLYSLKHLTGSIINASKVVVLKQSLAKIE